MRIVRTLIAFTASYAAVIIAAIAYISSQLSNNPNKTREIPPLELSQLYPKQDYLLRWCVDDTDPYIRLDWQLDYGATRHDDNMVGSTIRHFAT